MSIAFGKASQTNNHHPFQAFLFMTANTLLHELGHVFVTYLTKGQSASPPQVNAVTEGVQGGEGEAGLALESLIFGGTIAYFQEPVSGTPDDQVCFPTVALVEDQPFSIYVDVHCSAARLS